MKKALSYKILFILAIFAFSLALAFSFGGVKTARAADITATNIESYFSGAEKFELTGNLVATVTGEKNQVKIEKELVVDDLAIELTVPADKIDKYSVSLSYYSFFENAEPDKTTQYFVAEKGDVTIEFKTENNVLSVVKGAASPTEQIKIKGADKCVAEISFTFTLKADVESADIIIKSIDQKKSDGTGKYKQTFELEGGKIKTLAKPRVSINNLPIKKNDGEIVPADYGKLNVIYGKYYSFNSITAYSVFESSSETLFIDKDSVGENAWVSDSTTPNTIAFKNAAETDFWLCRKDGDNVIDLEKYTVLPAIKYNEDTNAPKYISYIDNTKIYNKYADLVKQAAKDGDHSILLGESFEIPSLKGLVTDDYDVYSDLKYTVYYRTPSNASGSTSSLKFTVSEAGEYEFYVVFKDSNGNEMEREDFYKLDEQDSSKIVGIDDISVAIADPTTVVGTYKYFPAVFRFTVQDDAPMSVTAPKSQGEGYLNVEYMATAFTIQSSGYNVTYKLYYNANIDADKDSEGWISIPQLADITEDYSDDVFTYSDVEKIEYDGKYNFTPVKLGAYKIECEVSSDKSERSESDATVIKVSEEPKVVKPDTHWLKNNIWSLVFLSIGTLALIGIIVLLFIKPKEEVETDETGDALKSKDNK